MPTDILVADVTAAVWANVTDYSSTVSGLARTAQLNLTGYANGAARMGAKVDLGATRAQLYAVMAALEWAVAGGGPLSGARVKFYWAGSPSATAGNANPGGTTGADADYVGTSGDALADAIRQLLFVGDMICTSDTTTVVEYQQIGVLEGAAIPRYGMPVVYNTSGQSFVADAVEMYVALLPIKWQSQ